MQDTWPEVVIAISGMVFLWTIVVVIIVQLAITWRARTAASKEENYRKLAEQTARNQQEIEKIVAKLTGDLADIREQNKKIASVLKSTER
jgi:hypothetical protein